jgi:hypothetical protein
MACRSFKTSKKASEPAMPAATCFARRVFSPWTFSSHGDDCRQ